MVRTMTEGIVNRFLSSTKAEMLQKNETEIEMLERNSGSGESYNDFRQANNEEILITILGQTLTTVQGERGGAFKNDNADREKGAA